MPAAVAVAGVFVGLAVVGVALRARVFGGLMRSRAAVVLAALSIAVLGCTPEGDTIIVTPTQTLVMPTTGNSSGATATPTPGATAIKFVRTGFFGGRCPAGKGEVRNGQPIAVDCVGYATATPLGVNDEKLEPSQHGYECTWSTDRSDVVRLESDGSNPFNVSVVAVRPGLARVTANVRGVTGHFDVTVVP
jgi:hypothetical protein